MRDLASGRQQLASRGKLLNNDTSEGGEKENERGNDIVMPSLQSFKICCFGARIRRRGRSLILRVMATPRRTCIEGPRTPNSPCKCNSPRIWHRKKNTQLGTDSGRWERSSASITVTRERFTKTEESDWLAWTWSAFCFKRRKTASTSNIHESNIYFPFDVMAQTKPAQTFEHLNSNQCLHIFVFPLVWNFTSENFESLSVDQFFQ